MLLGLPGLGVVLLVWAALLGYIGKLAASRGRSVAGWTFGALVGGGGGIAAGFVLAKLALSGDVYTSNFSLLAILLPPILLILPMLGIVYVLRSSPVNVAPRESWDVHFIPHGEGTISVLGANVRFAWANGNVTATMDQLTNVEPDGESVRIRGASHEGPFSLSVLPQGKPDSSDGRRQQSKILAQQLRGGVAPLPKATVVR